MYRVEFLRFTFIGLFYSSVQSQQEPMPIETQPQSFFIQLHDIPAKLIITGLQLCDNDNQVFLKPHFSTNGNNAVVNDPHPWQPVLAPSPNY